jgi:hypothetical protein
MKIGIGKAKITAWRSVTQWRHIINGNGAHRKLAAKRAIMKENSWYESNQ